MKQAWEKVTAEQETCSSRSTYKLKVEGGWLYRVEANEVVSEESRGFAVALAFVPAPAPSTQAAVKLTLPRPRG